ncbi:alpha/beta hydrolase [Lipingzhangella sp. LS1_29]|uniref:Alpha/beta hydrolase n=1 Tax=Lipingzhangella rawalii TaxID=2055835 RepID=A0ABU2H2W3_9ACTN|nr:alpha/beta hydrolase [Lipingzhangella rawalii]MDS1269631.1 alpha/beta hydrolase [Lipingzhangella rawalii]
MTDRLLTQEALADLADVPATGRWVRSGDLRLHLLDYGGDGVPLLVLPGITSPAISMDFVARELTDLVRPIVVDLRGRGLSDAAPEYTLHAYADDVDAIMTGLELDRPIVLGHSLGARIAAVAAARAPTSVRGSILVDPPMSGPGRGPYPTTLEMFRSQLQQAQRGTTAAEVAQSWPRWSQRERELRARWLASCDPESIDATHRGFETEDFFATWPSVPAPTTLVYGADSPVVTAEGAAEAAATNPAAALVAVEDAGHMVFWDNPTRARSVAREVLTTLGSHPTGASS